MSDRVSAMMKERNKASVHFLKFMMLISKDNKATICFFEGEDQQYYSIRIDLKFENLPWSGIVCGGKKVVLEVHALITAHEAYKNSLVAFFVDLDFDEKLPIEKRELIYETPCNSIENFYCTNHCISRILDIEFKLGMDPKRPNLLDDALKHYQALSQQFHTLIRPLNVWIKAQCLKQRLLGERPLNFQNVHLNALVRIEFHGVTSILSPTDIQHCFPGSHVLLEAEIDISDRLLPTADPCCQYRGKYELEFLRKYLEGLKQECNTPSSHFHNPNSKIKLTLVKNNIISELSQYALTPVCLSRFLSGLVQRSALNLR